MAVLINPLFKDLDFVLNNKDVESKEVFSYTLEIHAEGHRYESDAILSCDIIEDYVNAISTKKYIKIILPMGDFLRYVTSEKDMLEGTLITRYKTGETEVTYYRIIMNQDANNHIQTDDLSNLDVDTVNSQDHRIITLELNTVNTESVYDLRTGGIFKNIKVDDLLYSAMSTELGRVTLNGKGPIDHINMDQSSNENAYRQIIVPDNTRIFGLANFLQRKYGVYNAGIGVFVKRHFKDNKEQNDLFIYQLYNPDRFNKVKRKLVLIANPDKNIGAVDKTILVKEDIVYCVGEIVSQDSHKNATTTDLSTMGFQSINEDAFTKETVERTEAGPNIDPSAHVNTMLFSERSSGNNVIDTNNKSNVFETMSRVASQTGEYLTFKLSSAPPDKFLPGMSITLLYLKDNKPASVDGVLLNHHTTTAKITPGFVNKQYRSVTMLLLFVKSDIYKE